MHPIRVDACKIDGTYNRTFLSDDTVQCSFSGLAVWLSGNTVSIDVVTLRRAWLVHGWVTVFKLVNHPVPYYVTINHSARSTQPSLYR